MFINTYTKYTFVKVIRKSFLGDKHIGCKDSNTLHTGCKASNNHSIEETKLNCNYKWDIADRVQFTGTLNLNVDQISLNHFNIS